MFFSEFLTTFINNLFENFCVSDFNSLFDWCNFVNHNNNYCSVYGV